MNEKLLADRKRLIFVRVFTKVTRYVHVRRYIVYVHKTKAKNPFPYPPHPLFNRLVFRTC